LTTYQSHKRSLSIFKSLKMTCKETIQDEPIIEDWQACSIANKINCDYFNEKINTKERIESALVRKHYDSTVSSFIKNKKKPIIIILGCGFDTRYSRINEDTKQFIFYQIDTPEVISIRETIIPSTENDKNIQQPLLSEKWIKSITKKHKDGNFMIIIEQLLIHFSKKDIEFLFKKISENFTNCEIHFDTETNLIYSDSISILNKLSTKYNTLKLPDNFNYKSSKLLTEISEWKQIHLKKNTLLKALHLFNLPKHKFIHYSLN